MLTLYHGGIGALLRQSADASPRAFRNLRPDSPALAECSRASAQRKFTFKRQHLVPLHLVAEVSLPELLDGHR